MDKASVCLSTFHLGQLAILLTTARINFASQNAHYLDMLQDSYNCCCLPSTVH